MNYQNKILILFVSWWLIELKNVLYLIRKLNIYCKIVIIIIHFMQILPESDIRWRKSQRTYQIHFKDARNLTRFTLYLQSFFSYRHVLYLFRKLKTFCKHFILCKLCLRAISDDARARERTKFTLKTQEILRVSRHISSRFSATDMYCTSLESWKHFKKTLFYVK